MGAGKDTVAALLPQYTQLAFGDELRRVAKILRKDGVDACFAELQELFLLESTPMSLHEMIQLWSLIPQTKKERRLLQDIGTYCRTFDDQIWIRKIVHKAAKKEKNIITDVRRKVEFDAFPKFISIYIETDLDKRIERLKKRDGEVNLESFNHPAEQEIRELKPLCQYVITNNGTIEELKKKVGEIVKCINTKKK